MASFIYNKFLSALFSSLFDFTASSGQTFKLALLSSFYPAAENEKDTHDFFDDVSAFEIGGTGYTAGGKALTSVTVTQDNATNKAIVDADDVTWTASTMTFRYGILYRDTGTPATSPLIKLIDFGIEQSTSGTDFPVTWSAAGILNDLEA